MTKAPTESTWCLDELEKIKELTVEGKLVTIPIFYNVEPCTVRYHNKGKFGDALTNKNRRFNEDQMNKWKEALAYVSNLLGFAFKGERKASTFINEIVEEVLKALRKNWSDESTGGSVDLLRNTKGEEAEAGRQICGLKQRLEELKEKVNITDGETRIVQVIGMLGVGKTTLLKEFYERWNSRFNSHCLLQGISDIVKQWGLESLPRMLLKELLEDDDIEDGATYEQYKEKLRKDKVFIVLDGTSDKRHIQVLLEGYREWTKKGSKILIATRTVIRDDMVHGDPMVHDTYLVPLLSHRDGLEHFRRYAFNQSANKHDVEAFMKESKEIVRYARGHPLILQILGKELSILEPHLWKEKLDSFKQSLSENIRERVLQVTYDELSQEQKDAFLDIACFRSHDLVYVKSLLDSSGPEFPKATITIEALKDKFMIYISDSRVEMHDILYTFAMELGAKDERGRKRIWHGDMLKTLRKRRGGGAEVRSLFLDLYNMKKDVTLGTDHLTEMRDLRYLKFYSSHCPRECEPKENVHIPEKQLELPLEEVRCFHWLKYPIDELPQGFIPKNLVDLKLHYSKITKIWKDEQVAPKLRWVDLSHSSKLENLSGLSQSQYVERLNLEGCTALKTLPPGVQIMASLVFLNLKGCTALESLPKINLESLKTLILSNCTNLLNDFWVISESLEALYLDGTTITQLPTDIVKLTRLVKLYMKDCKMLEKLLKGFDKLQNLQELVCSGCSKLNSLPDEMEDMKCLQILLLDGTEITKIPQISSLERLCLSGNEKIRLLGDMTQLFQLKWLDLKYCKNLLSIAQLPPNLQCLDAHGCESLKTVASPLATHLPMEQIHSTFIFTNCDKLYRIAKEEITNYAQRKCQLLSDALKRCNEGFVPEALFSTCVPGCEVPSWFCHESVGSSLELKLPPHWNENRFVGIALCAVVSIPNSKEKIKSFSVTCKLILSINGLRISFDRLVGSWNKHGSKLEEMNSDHVFICYTRCSNNIKCLEDQHSGACTPTAASLEFGVTDENAGLEVLKCGLRLVYASDEPQKTNSDVATKKDNNVAESYETSLRGEEIELKGSPPIRNESLGDSTLLNMKPTGR
ncbi:disease resistance protein RPS4 [Eutrema salsugineum]|uniref:disease resistance protein RPS4 n=1 Tax=Eutrema salsugineum TaxID=72664 RepID=UPI000CED304C|nr:disease resistance protein RPS4 [Eutrema salsugineum]